MSPTEIMQNHIDLTKRETRELIEKGGLDCLTRGVLGLVESAGDGDMKLIDLVVNRLDGLLSEKVSIKPVIVEVIDYGDNNG
jgi:hypothetical protein